MVDIAQLKEFLAETHKHTEQTIKREEERLLRKARLGLIDQIYEVNCSIEAYERLQLFLSDIFKKFPDLNTEANQSTGD